MKLKLFSTMEQVSFVVKDLDRVVRLFADQMGIGPWKLFNFGYKEGDSQFNELAVKVENTILYGKYVGSYNVRIASCQIGSTEIELIQPEDQKSLFFQHLRENGQGVQHIAIDNLVDFERMLGIMAAQGYPLAQLAKVDDVEDCAFVDHMRTIGTYFEIHQRPEDFKFPAVLTKKQYKTDKKEIQEIFRNIEALVILVENVKSVKHLLEDIYGIEGWQRFYYGNDIKSEVCSGLNLNIILIEPEKNTQLWNVLKEKGPGILGLVVNSDLSRKETENIMRAAGIVECEWKKDSLINNFMTYDLYSWLGIYLLFDKKEI